MFYVTGLKGNKMKLKLFNIALVSLTLSTSMVVNAGVIYWADWQSNTSTEVLGEFVTNTSTIDIVYNNPQGISFLQNGTGVDYFNNHQAPSLSPYTSSVVDNIPTASEMIALEYAGDQTLSFSESVANLVLSFVSLNGSNYYSFDQDFDILSVGGVDGKSAGYWGAGTASKNIVDHGNGNIEYQLLGTGEPHGTIQFKGSFHDLSWNSHNDEEWNGFTVGIEGASKDVFTEVPEPSTLAIFSLGLLGLVTRRINNMS